MSSSHKTFSATVLSKAYASGASVLLVYVPRKREDKRIIKTKFCGLGQLQDIVLNAAQPVVVLNVEEVMNKLVYRGVPASCFKEAPKQRAA